MRDCPHCHKEIQDEARYCRSCRQDVEPPLWLTSLRKCPYCAEWVERGIDSCPLCSKPLIPEEAAAPQSEGESFLAKLRQEALDEEQEPVPAEEEIPSEPAPEIQTPMVYQTPSSPEPEEEEFIPTSQAGLAAMHSRSLEAEDPFDRRSTLLPVDEYDEFEELVERSFPIGRVARIAGVIFGIAIIGVILYFIVNSVGRIDLPALLPGPSDAAPADTATAELIPTATTQSAETIEPGALLPTIPPTGSPCVPWSQVSLKDEGETICSYGEVKRWFRVNSEMPYMAIFSEDLGTFAIADRTRTYPEYLPGDCIQVEGVVEVMRGSRPFIDAQGELAICPE